MSPATDPTTQHAAQSQATDERVKVALYLPSPLVAEIDGQVELRRLYGQTSGGPGATATRSAVVADLLRGIVGGAPLRSERAPGYDARPPREWVVRYRRAPLFPAWLEQAGLTAEDCDARARVLAGRGWEVEVVRGEVVPWPVDGDGGEE